MKILTHLQLYSGWTKLASDAPQYKQQSCISTTKSYRNSYVAITKGMHADLNCVARKFQCLPELSSEANTSIAAHLHSHQSVIVQQSI